MDITTEAQSSQRATLVPFLSPAGLCGKIDLSSARPHGPQTENRGFSLSVPLWLIFSLAMMPISLEH